jgi:antitoxin MazE
METITIPIIKIGGSRGIRIPKKVLEECHITDSVSAVIDHGEITLKPERKPREGWAKEAKDMHARGEDKLLIDDLMDLNLKEWEW